MGAKTTTAAAREREPRVLALAARVAPWLGLILAAACRPSLPPAQAPQATPEPDADPLPVAAHLPSLDASVPDPADRICPEIAPDADSLRFGGDARPLECTRPGVCRPHRRLVGASLPELAAFAGAPTRCLRETWTYEFGATCEDERDRLILTVDASEVLAARHEHLFAGEACDAP